MSLARQDRGRDPAFGLEWTTISVYLPELQQDVNFYPTLDPAETPFYYQHEPSLRQGPLHRPLLERWRLLEIQ